MSDIPIPFGFAKPVIVLPQERRVRVEDEDQPSKDPARKETT